MATVILLAGLMAVMTSCEHKDLCYNHAHGVEVEVIFDWRDAPDANPKSMSLYLFPKEGGEPIRYEFTDRNGGIIRVPIGEYDAMCQNSDTENVFYRNTGQHTTFETTTREATLLSGLSSLGVRSDSAPRADGTDNERTLLSPDMLWTDHSEGIWVKLNVEKQTITLYPKTSVCKYTVEIRNAANLKYVHGISGSLSSLAGGLLPGVGADALTDELVTVPFDAYIGTDDAGEKTIVTGGLQTFGHCPLPSNRHQLVIYAVLADDSKWYYTYDVTEQIHSAPDQRNVHIILDGLPLPKPIVNGGGFQPTVDEWKSEKEENIPM